MALSVAAIHWQQLDFHGAAEHRNVESEIDKSMPKKES